MALVRHLAEIDLVNVAASIRPAAAVGRVPGDATVAVALAEEANRLADIDQFLDDRGLTGLSVLMGGGRKWFLPASTPGSARGDRSDYAFSATDAHTADIVKRWNASPGKLDKDRDLIADFQNAGFQYASDLTSLNNLNLKSTDKLLGFDAQILIF